MLDFNYCECGCKGYEASAGHLHFWIYWDLAESYHLHRGHGWASPKIKTCSSMEEAVALATEEAKAELVKMQAALDAAPVKKPSIKTRLERV